ncbi:hypothetical protein BX616_005976 [Lobosporangium transversale]|nr:hypothetical protein BX616_005976 [Lobosporangium transversale]
MAMDNKTVRDAIQIHGTDPQFLIEKILRTRIYESTYWKEHCFGLTESSIIEKAYELKYIGGQYGVQKPTEFICLVLKLLQIQPREEIVIKYITGLTESDNNKYLRALGAFYLRLVGKPVDIYNYLEPLLDDSRKLRKRGAGYSIIHMDEFIDDLLREERVCDIVLPRLVKRHVLEDAGELDPRISTLEKLEMELEEERKAEEAAARREDGGKRSRSSSRSRSRSISRSPSRSRSRSVSRSRSRSRSQSRSRSRSRSADRSRRSKSRGTSRSRSKSRSPSRSRSPHRDQHSYSAELSRRNRTDRTRDRSRSTSRSRSPDRKRRAY